MEAQPNEMSLRTRCRIISYTGLATIYTWPPTIWYCCRLIPSGASWYWYVQNLGPSTNCLTHQDYERCIQSRISSKTLQLLYYILLHCLMKIEKLWFTVKMSYLQLTVILQNHVTFHQLKNDEFVVCTRLLWLVHVRTLEMYHHLNPMVRPWYKETTYRTILVTCITN